ncbi:MAG: hypothetical protein AAF423_04850 [Pseudomonadota bacterium]
MREIVLTDEHYSMFGRIIFGYAAAESGFKILLSAMLKMDVGVFMAVSAPYQSRDLKDVVKSIAKLSEFEHEDEYDKIIDLVGRFQGFSHIRNEIAHCRWTEGVRGDSIKPISVKVGKGKVVAKGFDDGERDYTNQELIDLANGIFKLNNDLRRFIVDYGYAEIIEEKMQESSTADK